jgi:vitamin B12/bleomycin/antimicrobial peptide transport system ATP-binding/permease protein
MLQAAEAFGNVQKALSFFVGIYRTMAEWRAVVARLDGFEMSVASAEHLKKSGDSIRLTAPGGGDEVDLQKLLVRLPNGTPLISADDFRIRPSERLLVIGPSGAGKSTLFRAIAGIWPFGSGSISIPAHASLMMLPQKPYFPIGTLHAAIAFPSEATAFGADRIKEVLTEVGLPQLALRIEDEEHWNRILSLGEQQRLGIARALLQAPKFLFLDEATASLDEPAEAALYRLLQEKLPATTVVSIGHRATLDAFHQRKTGLVREGDHFVLPGASESAKP